MSFDWTPYLTKGLLWYFFLCSLCFTIIALVWNILFFFNALPNATAYLGVLDDLNIVIGFVYYIWLNDSLHGYSAGPGLFFPIRKKN